MTRTGPAALRSVHWTRRTEQAGPSRDRDESAVEAAEVLVRQRAEEGRAEDGDCGGGGGGSAGAGFGKVEERRGGEKG